MNLTVGDLLDTGVGVVMTFLDDRLLPESRSQLKPFMPTGGHGVQHSNRKVN